MTVVELPKRQSWTSVITSLRIDEEFKADYSLQNTICSLISGRIKLKYPDRLYETWKTSELIDEAEQTYRDYLNIKRLK